MASRIAFSDTSGRKIFVEKDHALIVERIMQAGGAVGMDDVITAAGYGVGTVDAYAGSARIALGGVNALMRELPTHLVSDTAKKLASNSSAMVTPQIARQLRREWLALSDWPSSRYMGTIAAKLNGRVNFLKGAGKATTWYIPAAIGLYNVIDAPPELRMRTLFAEGFGVVGGAIGTAIGAQAIGASLVPVLCLGPFGAFILIFIMAAGFGLAGSELGKRFGSDLIYDYGSILGDKVFHSVDELLEGF